MPDVKNDCFQGAGSVNFVVSLGSLYHYNFPDFYRQHYLGLRVGMKIPFK